MGAENQTLIVKKEKTFQEKRKMWLSIRLSYYKIGKDMNEGVISDAQYQIQTCHVKGQR